MHAQHRRYPLLALLSVFAVLLAGWNCALFSQLSGIPITLNNVTPHQARVAQLHSLQMPQGLHPGDRVDFARQSTTTRMDLLASLNMLNIRQGHALPLVITREDGRSNRIRVSTRRLDADPAMRVVSFLGIAWSILSCLIILVTLWRGRDRAAWGILVWAMAFQIGIAFDVAPTSDQLGFALDFLAQLSYLVARAGFFVMAFAIAGPALSAANRRRFVYAFLAALLVGYAYELCYVILFVYGAVLIPPITSLVWDLPYVIASLLLLSGFHNAQPAWKPRLRWMFWSAVIIVIGILLSNAPLLGYPYSNVVEVLAYFLGFCGLLYSVLRHRVVDMSFVVNRAIVYSATLTVVIGIFILLESFLEKLALSEKESLALELAVPLIIGFTLEALRKRLEKFSERILFRQKFRNENALRAFARQCAYIENPDHLLEQTLRELTTHTNTAAAAFYWREQDTYRRIAASRATPYPATASIDDRAFVALRSDRSETDLENLCSDLGGDGLLLPMTVRGDLLGAIVLANRPGEHFPPDERELLAHLVHEVGSALHALHARENARFVSAVAEGRLIGEELAAKARLLNQSG